MTKQDEAKLYQLMTMETVNLLSLYFDSRIDKLKDHLTTVSLEELKYTQGQINELKKLKKMREDLQQRSKS